MSEILSLSLSLPPLMFFALQQTSVVISLVFIFTSLFTSLSPLISHFQVPISIQHLHNNLGPVLYIKLTALAAEASTSVSFFFLTSLKPPHIYFKRDTNKQERKSIKEREISAL